MPIPRTAFCYGGLRFKYIISFLIHCPVVPCLFLIYCDYLLGPCHLPSQMSKDKRTAADWPIRCRQTRLNWSSWTNPIGIAIAILATIIVQSVRLDLSTVVTNRSVAHVLVRRPFAREKVVGGAKSALVALRPEESRYRLENCLWTSGRLNIWTFGHLDIWTSQRSPRLTAVC